MAKTSSVSPARQAAFEILQRVADGAYASVLLAARAEELGPQDRALCHELVMGVLRHQLWLDRLAEHYSRRKAVALDLPVRIALRLGLYQLRFLSRVPASAAVNESVNLVHLARLRSAASFVNAVLRRATREPDIDPTSNIDDPLEHLSVATSHPAWLLERWQKAFGAAEAEAFAFSNNEAAPVAFRVVSSRADEADICESLRQSGVELTPSKVTKGAWRVSGGGSLLAELASNGQIYLQDEASQLVARALGAKAGDRVLDLCAAPGSKTTQIADRSAGTAAARPALLNATGGAYTGGAFVVASDLHEHRLRTLVTTAKLQGLSNIHCVALDGSQALPFAERSFDRVLVDAPCSGTGTLRRNPEIRWRISPADIEQMRARQTRLLNNAARAVKPGGQLIYSTCSVEPDENEAVVETFLENHENFQLGELTLDSDVTTSAGMARTWPHRDGTDGFFICALERKGE